MWRINSTSGDPREDMLWLIAHFEQILNSNLKCLEEHLAAIPETEARIAMAKASVEVYRTAFLAVGGKPGEHILKDRDEAITVNVPPTPHSR
jgi:hypothetical protein